MRTLHFLFLTFIISFLCSSQPVKAQTSIDNIPTGRYLVIGSFYIEKNAIGFAEYVRKMDQYDVTMAYHPITKFYHVYIKGYPEDQNGRTDVKRMRQETEFIDTWFMIVTPYSIDEETTEVAQVEQEATADESQDDDNIIEQETEEQTDGNSGWVRAATPISQANSNTQEDTTTSSDVEKNNGEGDWVKASNVATMGSTLDDDPNIIPETYNQKGKYKLFFNTYYTKNYKEVKGPVDIINPTSLKLLRTEPSLELVQIPDPNNGKHSVQLIANIFGYKKVQHDINLEEPLDSINREFFHFKGDTLVADFPLQRYETGEIATMYNVFFFKDAVIMKPISNFEMNSLVDMLKENDDLRIKVHGHTNGNSRGKIILLPDSSENFFSLNQEVIENSGTAKELSLQRANVIKDYLITFGIAADRMEVIGWGGKKPIYDKMDKLAIKNVRVEIEILDQ